MSVYDNIIQHYLIIYFILIIKYSSIIFNLTNNMTRKMWLPVGGNGMDLGVKQFTKASMYQTKRLVAPL